MKYRASLLVPISAAAATLFATGGNIAARAQGPDGVMFKRLFRPGSIAEFSFKQDVKALNSGTEAILRERVLKPAADGTTRVTYETVSIVGTGTATVPPSTPPVTTNVPSNALGTDFGFTAGPTDFLYFLLASAAISPEKQVKAGDEFPLKWSSTKQPFSIEGRGKILSITAKEVKEDISLRMTFQGQSMGTLHWVSTTSTIDYSLLWAQGAWLIKNTIAYDMIFTRKAPSGS